VSERPSPEQIAAAHGRTLRDVIGPGIRVLLVGINPSLYSAAAGHHFARPGNRFWKALHASGFTERLLSPDEDSTLPERGMGITNLVARATASAAELNAGELWRGARRLEGSFASTSPHSSRSSGSARTGPLSAGPARPWARSRTGSDPHGSGCYRTRVG
jgi:TDG/mug DNA glycosylase family protein